MDTTQWWLPCVLLVELQLHGEGCSIISIKNYWLAVKLRNHMTSKTVPTFVLGLSLAGFPNELTTVHHFELMVIEYSLTSLTIGMVYIKSSRCYHMGEIQI